MPNVRITDLPELFTPLQGNELLEVVDVNDLSISVTGTSKQLTLEQVYQFVTRQLKPPALVVVITAVTKNSAVVNGGILSATTLTTGRRVLLIDQFDAAENGLWMVQASGPPLRPVDFAVGSAASACLVMVQVGVLKGSFWTCTAPPGSDVVGTNVLPFVLVNSPQLVEDVLASESVELDTRPVRETPIGAVDGTNNTFVLSYMPITESLLLFVNGLLKTVNHSYTTTGWAITFDDSAIPQPGDMLDAQYYRAE